VKELVRPRRLAPGARVAVVATSGPVSEERLQTGLDVLRGWDLDPVAAPHVLDRHSAFGHLAGADADRAADFQNAWCDPAVDAVLCARGGYGAQRMLDLLDWDALRAAGPKPFIGFSDVTVVHEALATRLGLATLYGPVAAGADFVKNQRAQEHLRATLFAPETVRTLVSGGTALVPGRARGVTVGGCLCLLAGRRRAGGCSAWRTSASRPTGWTGTSPNSCARAGSTGCAGCCSAPGRTAPARRSCGPCSPTGSAGSGCRSRRTSDSGTAKGR
jgi:muramoyltetrapeptide carboxypeptidase